mgnify:CR=1 FL=1
MYSRDILKSSRREFSRRKTKLLVIKLIIGLFIIVLLAALLSWGSRNEKSLIKGVKIEGNETISAEEVLKITEKKISGKYIFLFPKNNIFIYPGGAIAEEILDNMKKVKTVETKIGDGNILLVKVYERKPSYIWCPGQLPPENTISDNQCYFLDEQGLSFSEAPRFSGPVFFEIYASSTVGNEFIGKYPFEGGLFKKLTLFKDALLQINIPATGLIRMNDGDFKFVLKTGGAVLINEKNDINISLRNIVSAKKALEDGGKNISLIEYIDLRFGNKVFFKFK